MRWLDATSDEVAPHLLRASARDLEVPRRVTAAVGVPLDPQLEDPGVFDENPGQLVEEGDLARLDVVAARREVSLLSNLKRGLSWRQLRCSGQPSSSWSPSKSSAASGHLSSNPSNKVLGCRGAVVHVVEDPVCFMVEVKATVCVLKRVDGDVFTSYHPGYLQRMLVRKEACQRSCMERIFSLLKKAWVGQANRGEV